MFERKNVVMDITFPDILYTAQMCKPTMLMTWYGPGVYFSVFRFETGC